MNDKLKELIGAGAIDGAKEVYAKYEEYEQACADAKAEYEAKLSQLDVDYAEALKLYALVESVKNSIIGKLSPKEE